MPILGGDTDLDRSFVCPSCKVFSRQRARRLLITEFMGREWATLKGKELAFLDCDGCGERILFAEEDIIYPEPRPAVGEPNSHLNDEIKADYLEAASILKKSPRASSALLRLCLMKLMKQLSLSGDLNEDIRKLVRKGLDTQVQEACDSLRVIGNKAVHPGTLDVGDNEDVARGLFDLLNFIADQMITQPEKRSELFEKLVPSTVKDQIRRRDAT